MTASTRDALRALFPHFDGGELDEAAETIRRYVVLATEITAASQLTLTEGSPGGTVIAGQVDPSTFTNTG